jgi:hypothetical protein
VFTCILHDQLFRQKDAYDMVLIGAMENRHSAIPLLHDFSQFFVAQNGLVGYCVHIRHLYAERLDCSIPNVDSGMNHCNLWRHEPSAHRSVPALLHLIYHV